jgi:signal transduction histidine kinase
VIDASFSERPGRVMSRDERRFRMSLARKLSLLTGVVIALSLLIVLGVAYEVLTRSAISGASESLARATRQLASVAESNIRLSRARWDSVVHQPALRGALVRPTRDDSRAATRPATDSTIATALRTIGRLTSPVDSGLPTELWNADGQRVTGIGLDQPVLPESPGNERPLGTSRIPLVGFEEIAARDSLQFGRLYASGGRVYFWLVQPVLEHGRPIGYIAQQRRLATNPQADRSVRALAGEGVSMYYHNSDGSVWSTVGGSPASPSHPKPNEPVLATRGARQELLTAEAQIGGTPLVITMESRLADVLASPRRTVRDLMLVGLLLLVGGMVAALLIGRGVARPIVEIADGAEAIARGEYDTRVPAVGDLEIVRLASSFNHMANEVAVAHRALEQKTADAQSANRAKSDFLATVSHELRTPLNAIAGYTELLEMGLRGPLTDAQRRDLARIRASGQHLLGLISGVLDLNRIERGAVTYTLVPIAIDQFLSDLDALVSPQAAAKSLTLEYVPSEQSLSVLADREKLRQIILNLLSNAIRYTPAGGRIRLSSSALGSTQVAIGIDDTGPGIPADRRGQVFEPFVQLDRSLTQPQEGLGLGLAISRDLARGLGGDLTLTDGAVGGASFLLTLPRAPSEAAIESRTSGETAASRSA